MVMIEPRKLFGGLGNRLFQMAYLYARVKDGTIPDIYIQDEKWFENAKEDIKAMYGQGIGKRDMVSLHIRRGDYLNNTFYVNLAETDYYERAMAYFPDAKFLVFCADRQNGSDDKADMEWCKQKFKGKQFEFWEGGNEIDDLNAMASCRGHIMANSSFSFWGAYLGGGKTIAPKAWFTDGKERIKLLDEWTII